MPWWGWLILAWTLVAVPLAVRFGRGIKRSDDVEWERRGRPDRRKKRR